MVAGDVKVSLTTNNGRKCAAFDGVSNKITLTTPTFAFLDLSLPFSISFWIKGNDQVAQARGIMSKYTTTGNKRAVLINKNTVHKLNFTVSANGTSSVSAGTPNVAITDNVWYHCVCLYDGTNIKAYTNTTVGTSTASTGGNDNNVDWIIGYGDTTVDYWAGQIADVRFYEVALTTSEISTLYAGGEVLRGLRHRYGFFDGTYNDSIGTYNGTNSGSYITIADGNIGAAVKSQRVAATDNWLIARSGINQVLTAEIE